MEADDVVRGGTVDEGALKEPPDTGGSSVEEHPDTGGSSAEEPPDIESRVEELSSLPLEINYYYYYYFT